MNSTAKALAKAQFSMEGALPFLMSRQFWLICVLAVCILLSALAVIYTRDASRLAFIETQQLQQTQDDLHIRWGRLLLEESSWSTARIQAIAQHQLGMHMPIASHVIVVH